MVRFPDIVCCISVVREKNLFLFELVKRLTNE